MIDFDKKVINSDKFRQAAIHFEKHGSYCLYPYGTTEYNKYWDQEAERCRYGWTAEDGDWISGYNYFYLNYCPIQRLIEEEYTDRYGNVKKRRVRESAFPAFYDYDYFYFQYIEDCEENDSHGVVLKARGKGYEQPYSELIATPNGFVQMGNLKIGDEVLNPDGMATTVVDIHEQGFKDVFELKLDDGRSVRCGNNHLWRVINASNKFKEEILTTRQMYQRGLFNTYNGYNHYRYYLEQIEEVQYSEKEFLIDPYILGALLGDGCLNKKTPKISTADEEILAQFNNILGNDYSLNRDNSCFNYRIVYNKRFDKCNIGKFENAKYGVNPLHRYLKELYLNVTHEYKFIPTEYKFGSVQQRYALVQGLMDTDGSISPDGSIEFTNTSKQLVEDLAEILRSIGIRCEIGIDNRINKFCYRLHIRTDKPIFRLTRKLSRLNHDKKINSKVAIIDIVRLGYQENSRCIEVSNDNHMYLTKDYIPTHNSFKGGSMLCRNYFLFPNSKSYAVASEAEFLTKDGLLTKAWEIMDFIDKNTAWAKKRVVDRTMHKRSGFIITDEMGNKTEQGYLSEIIGVTLKDKPDRIRGKRGKLILWEEAGMFKDILQAWQIARPGMEEGGTAFGLMIAYGCVCAGTKVIDKDGNFINVEDLNPSNGILGWDTYQAVPQNIEAINDPSEKKCVRITTSTGRMLECSEDHPVLWSTPGKTKRVVGKRKENDYVKDWRWHPASECKVGEQVGVIDAVPYFGSKKLWEPRFIGWLIGDGSYGFDKTPVLSNKDSSINNYIDLKFDTVIEKCRETNSGELYRETRIKGITHKLREIGIYGQTKKDKRLPKNIHEYDAESIAELLGGLFDTDGYIGFSHKRGIAINITQSHKEILEEIRDLLHHFGIHGRICTIKPSGRSHKCGDSTIVDKNPYYRFDVRDVCSVSNFCKFIKLNVEYKQKALDLIEIYVESKSAKHHKYVSGVHAERIVSVESLGVRTIYNLTAKEHHNYIANGIITHNTGGSEGDDFIGLESLFYETAGYNIHGLPNIWDENVAGTKCGFFVPEWSNISTIDKDGEYIYMDQYGNSLTEKAVYYSNEERRKVLDNATNSNAVDRYIAEHPNTPREACLELTGNIFPKKELQQQLAAIKTNSKLQAHKQVGDLIWDGNGGVKWIQKKTGDITRFPLGKNDDPTGSIVIWEHPMDNPPMGLYIGGCLLPGEKVLTDVGLMNVEDVGFNNHLVSKDGELVEIKNLQRYSKVNEDTYRIRTSNNYRSTVFTGEHPIYVKRDGEFVFEKARGVEVGDWIKYPNVYLSNGNWTGSEQFEDDLDFWWFVGLWLGDGWCDKIGKICIAFNPIEREYIEKCTNIVKNLFCRSPYIRNREGAVELSFNLKSLSEYLKRYFGFGASGKYISEWVKFINNEQKESLLLGYLASDGCVTKSKRGFYNIEFVSISLELLEGIQDILFSLGYISSLNLLSRAKMETIKGRSIKQKETYHLRISNNSSVKFKINNNHLDSTKLLKIDTIVANRKTPKRDCYLSDDLKYIYFQIKEIQQDFYTGIVYNFECDTHTFLTRGITTHNCDPYDHDQAQTNSLGSMFVYKRFQGFEEYYDIIVAEYTGRPSTAEEYYENVRKLLTYYNARLLYENERKGLFVYFTNKHCDYLLADQPDIISDIVGNSKVQRRKGIHMTKSIRDYGEGLVKEWLNEEFAPGRKNLTTILSEPLLEELIRTNGKMNVDRLIALIMVMIYREQLHNQKVKEVKEESKRQMLFDTPIFGDSWWGADSGADTHPLFTL